MKLDNLFTDDDRAVSPVIGVVLMVAITVILAAVIGSFVLNLSNSTGESAPQATLDAELSQPGSTGPVYANFTQNGGEAIQASDTKIVFEYAGTSATTGPATSDSTLAVGESAGVAINGSASVAGDSWSTLSGADAGTDLSSGDVVTIRVIDVPSQQIIASFELTF